MQSNAPFRYVIVGSGNICRTYLKAIANSPGLAVAGVVSRNGRRPEGLPGSAGVWPTLVAVDVPFDAVILTTPNGLHHQGAIEAAALGKHVLTEKVLEISRDAMDRMMHACREANVKLAVTYQRRMSPDNRALKQLLDAGRLGRVFAADMTVKFWRDAAYYRSGAYRGTRAVDGGGAFTQQAAHNADLLCWFFGLPDKVVSLCDRFVHDIEVEDHGVALLHYPNGMIGTFTASTACRPGFATLEHRRRAEPGGKEIPSPRRRDERCGRGHGRPRSHPSGLRGGRPHRTRARRARRVWAAGVGVDSPDLRQQPAG